MINYFNHTKEKEIRMINEKSKKHGHINGLKKSSKETFNLYVTKTVKPPTLFTHHGRKQMFLKCINTGLNPASTN